MGVLLAGYTPKNGNVTINVLQHIFGVQLVVINPGLIIDFIRLSFEIVG